MKLPGILRGLVGFMVGVAFVFSLAAPARAQFDPMTISLIIGGIQLLTGAISAIAIGESTDTRKGIAMPYGTPCGIVDGVPQICWQPHAGGFEGSPDLPTGAKSVRCAREDKGLSSTHIIHGSTEVLSRVHAG